MADESDIQPESTVAVPPTPPRAKQNIDRFIGILGVLGCLLVFTLQANGVEMNWEFSLGAYALVASGCVWSCLRHAIPHIGPNWRYPIALFVLIGVGILGFMGTNKQYERDHPNVVTPQDVLAQLSSKPEGETPKPPAENTRSHPLTSPARTPSLRVKEIVVTAIRATNLAASPGEYTSAFVRLGVNSSNSIPLKMYQVSAIQPFYSEGGARQTKVEDDLWTALIQSEQLDAPPIQLSSRNQDIGVPLSFKVTSKEELTTIDTEQGRYYFLFQLKTLNGNSVLDVCFNVDKKGIITYCRYHNGT
jgi:hypothetical protein